MPCGEPFPTTQITIFSISVEEWYMTFWMGCNSTMGCAAEIKTFPIPLRVMLNNILAKNYLTENVHSSTNLPVSFSFSYAVSNKSKCADEQLLELYMFEEKNGKNSLLYFHSVHSMTYKIDLHERHENKTATN